MKRSPDELVLDWIVGLLHDFGLGSRAIVEAVNNTEVNIQVIGDALADAPDDEMAAIWIGELYEWEHPEEDDRSGLPAAKYSLIRKVLAYSPFGIDGSRPHADMRILQENLRPSLSVYGLQIDFSPHDTGADFTMRVGRGDRVRKKDYSSAHDRAGLAGKVDVINALLAEHALRYVELAPGEEPFGYFLLADSRLQALREKYGPAIAEIISG